jgi:methylated-DNA-[protein]-cysteine S-methyltransferase
MKFHPDTQIANISTPLGPMIAAAGPLGLCGLWFEGQKHFFLGDISHIPLNTLHPMLQKTKQWLESYFDETQAVPSVNGFKLDFSLGTDFQQSVWKSLLRIGTGHLDGYGAIAKALGKPAASRAVGAAVGRNPISIIVPCHRVVGANGALTGYAGGIERKAWMLKREGVLL